MDQAFSGLRVYDASQGVAGPYATMLMALHGADVVKVEPLGGDWSRVLGTTFGDHCAHSLVFNRGKRSIALDTKSPRGRTIAWQLARDADILVESFRPGVMARAGLDYETLRTANPALVYASLTGFGEAGPYRDRPTVDALIQAHSGLMAMNATPDGVPRRQPMVVVDVLSGLYLFHAISAAVLRRFRFGEGQRVAISLMEAAAAFQAAKIAEHHLEGATPRPLYVPLGVFATASGHLAVSVRRNDHFAALCAVLGRSGLVEDPRFASQELRITHAEPLLVEIRRAFLERPARHWVPALQQAGVLAEYVNDYAAWMADPQVAASGALMWIEQSGVGRVPLINIPGAPSGGALGAHSPHVGEHSRAILAEIGYDDDAIEALVETRVLGEPAAPARV